MRQVRNALTLQMGNQILRNLGHAKNQGELLVVSIDLFRAHFCMFSYNGVCVWEAKEQI